MSPQANFAFSYGYGYSHSPANGHLPSHFKQSPGRFSYGEVGNVSSLLMEAAPGISPLPTLQRKPPSAAPVEVNRESPSTVETITESETLSEATWNVCDTCQPLTFNFALVQSHEKQNQYLTLCRNLPKKCLCVYYSQPHPTNPLSNAINTPYSPLHTPLPPLLSSYTDLTPSSITTELSETAIIHVNFGGGELW